MKELKKIVLFSFLLLTFFMDSFADAEWQQNGARENYDENELLQNGASELNYNDVESEAVDSDSWKNNIIDEDKEGTGVGGDNFNNGGGHVTPEMRSAKNHTYCS